MGIVTPLRMGNGFSCWGQMRKFLSFWRRVLNDTVGRTFAMTSAFGFLAWLTFFGLRHLPSIATHLGLVVQSPPVNLGWATDDMAGYVTLAFALVFLLAFFLYVPWKFYQAKADRVEELLDERKQKLWPTCGTDIAGCSVLTKFDQETDEHYGHEVRYLRVKVVSSGIRAIPKCAGFLTRIKRDGVDRMGHESVQLTFAPKDDPDSLSKRIYPRVPVYLDVLSLMDDNTVSICTKKGKAPYSFGKDLFTSPGIYLLTVSIAGKGIETVETELEFTWDNNWGTAKLFTPPSPA
jgi:hypothetical protein